MYSVRDLFFDEFYKELDRVIQGIKEEKEPEEPILLADQIRDVWTPYSAQDEEREEPLISVDGGVQYSRFAYGNFVAVGRACALIHWPERDRIMEKKVRIYIDKVFNQRDRSFIPSYVRLITEHKVAYNAAKRVLEEGAKPIVLLDGALYYTNFPHATREYIHHAELLAEMFTSIAKLRSLAREHNFPIVGVSKDSTVFYLYMRLLMRAVKSAGLKRLASMIEDAYTPMDLRYQYEGYNEGDKRDLEPFIEKRLLCDTALVYEATDTEGYTQPLLLSPSIYYRRGEDIPTLFRRMDDILQEEKAEQVKDAFKDFFSSPGIGVIYWKPRKGYKPFRVDIIASSLGHHEPWESIRGNRLVDPCSDLSQVETILNHLGYWFCNDVEYNLPLKQADILARFDRMLYKSKYEPFIIDMLERAGRRMRGTRRSQREMY